MATLQQILTIATNRGGAVDDLSLAMTTGTPFMFTNLAGVLTPLNIQTQHIDAAIQRTAALGGDVAILADANFPALLARELDGETNQVVRHDTILPANSLLNFAALPEGAFPSGLGGNEVYAATSADTNDDPVFVGTAKVGDTAFLSETDDEAARIWVLMSAGPDVWFEVTASQQDSTRPQHEIMRRNTGDQLSLKASDITVHADAEFVTKNPNGSITFNNPRTVQLGDVHDYVTIEARNATELVEWHRGDIAIVNGFVASSYTATSIVIPVASNPFLVAGDLISVVGSSEILLTGTFRIDAVQTVLQTVILVMDLTTDLSTYIAWPGIATTTPGVLGSITTGNEGTYFYTGVDQTAVGVTVSSDWTAITNTATSGVTSVVGRTGVVSDRQIAAALSDQRLAFDNQVGIVYGNTAMDHTGDNQLTITGTQTGGSIEANGDLSIEAINGILTLQTVDNPLIQDAATWDTRFDGRLNTGFVVGAAAAQIDLTGIGAQVNLGPENAGGLHPLTLEYNNTDNQARIESNGDLLIDATGAQLDLNTNILNITAPGGFTFNTIPFATARLDVVSSHIAEFSRTQPFTLAQPAMYTFAANRFDPVPTGLTDIQAEFNAGRFELYLAGLKLIRRTTRVLTTIWDYEISLAGNIVLRFESPSGKDLNELFDNTNGTLYLEMMRRT